MAESFLRWETQTGEPVVSAGWQIVPVSRALVIHSHSIPSGLVWNRPNAIVVTGADGQEQKLLIYNETRRQQLLWLGAGLLGSLLIGLIFSLLRKDKHSIPASSV
ncbi:MAG: hypothetical protein P4L50_03940 [Anaerolineaceae bacterium]|nr:hypothetical protein [Anaerolineaceae bacterium]